MRVWRITGPAHAAFDGERARLYGSRGRPRGVPAIFTSATLSLGALERFVHTNPDLELPDLVAISVDISDAVDMEAIDIIQLPDVWRAFPPPPSFMMIGDQWVRAAGTALLSVLSVLIPLERNFLLNRARREFVKLTIGRREPFTFDPRMCKK